MSWQLPWRESCQRPWIDKYLKPTELCDCNNEELRSKAKEITKDAPNPKEAALRIFSFVRDGIPWSLDHNDTKASATLKKRSGHCVNKTNLQVALLRAVGIPARYHQGKIKKEWMRGVISDFVYNRVPEIVWWHPWCECYLAEKWVMCESVLDKALLEGMFKKDLVTPRQIPSVDWDGSRDLIVMETWFKEDVGSFASLDEVFRKAEKELSRPFGGFFMSRSNRRTEELRKGKK